MDYKEEQAQELEAIQSIYTDEFKGKWHCKILYLLITQIIVTSKADKLFLYNNILLSLLEVTKVFCVFSEFKEIFSSIRVKYFVFRFNIWKSTFCLINIWKTKLWYQRQTCLEN